jgi:hypothetical protein
MLARLASSLATALSSPVGLRRSGLRAAEAVHLDYGPVMPGFRFRVVGEGSGSGSLEGLGVDQEEQLALPDQVPSW